MDEDDGDNTINDKHNCDAAAVSDDSNEMNDDDGHGDGAREGDNDDTLNDPDRSHVLAHALDVCVSSSVS